MGPQQYAAIGDTVGKVIGNIIGRKSNKETLRKQAQGLDAQSDYITDQSESMRNQYDNEFQPYTEAGEKATSELSNMDTDVNNYGAMKGTTSDAYKFEMDDFKTDPGYEFRLSQGTEALDQSAAGDSLYSGGQQKALLDYGQNLASDEYQNVYDREFTASNQANSDFNDARDYNTNLDANNLNRGIGVNQGLSNQGYGASTNVANATLGINQDETAFGVDNIGQQYGNKAAQTANKYGFASDQNKIASDGFQKFMGGSSFGG